MNIPIQNMQTTVRIATNRKGDGAPLDAWQFGVVIALTLVLGYLIWRIT